MKYTIDIPEEQVERLERKRIIGMNIDNRRREMKLSQQKLAIKVGTSQFMIAKWCQGRYMPGIIYLYKLSKVFGCSMEDLLEGIKI